MEEQIETHLSGEGVKLRGSYVPPGHTEQTVQPRRAVASQTPGALELQRANDILAHRFFGT